MSIATGLGVRINTRNCTVNNQELRLDDPHIVKAFIGGSPSFHFAALELSGSVVSNVMQAIRLWGVVDYTTEVAGNDIEVMRGNADAKMSW